MKTRIQIGKYWVEWLIDSQEKDITVEEYFGKYIEPAMMALSSQIEKDRASGSQQERKEV